MSRIIPLSILTLFIILSGCHSVPYAEMPVFLKDGVGWHKVRIEGEVNLFRLRILAEGLETLPGNMATRVQAVVYHTNREHLASYYCGAREIYLAHALGGTICFDASAIIAKKDIYHEVAHLYEAGLSRQIAKEWAALSGDIYRPNYRDFYGNYHEFGVVDAYGLVNAREDIAVTVQEIYNYCADGDNKLAFAISRFTPENKGKMLRKLKILLETEMIDQEKHDKVKVLCEN